MALPSSDIERFKSMLGYTPNLSTPTTLNEKLMCYKQTFDSSLSIWADKIQVRTLIPKKYLNNATYSYSPDFTIQKPSYLKMNNASGRNTLSDNMNREKIKQWFTLPYGLNNGEWDALYKHIPPGLLIEDLLDLDHLIYRFFLFHGRVEFIQVYRDIVGRSLTNTSITTYDRRWKKMDILFKDKPTEQVTKPKHFDEMLSFVESFDFTFARIDLYDLDRIIFSEVTFFPQSCKIQMPYEWDKKLGGLL